MIPYSLNHLVAILHPYSSHPEPCFIILILLLYVSFFMPCFIILLLYVSFFMPCFIILILLLYVPFFIAKFEIDDACLIFGIKSRSLRVLSCLFALEMETYFFCGLVLLRLIAMHRREKRKQRELPKRRRPRKKGHTRLPSNTKQELRQQEHYHHHQRQQQQQRT